MRVVYFDNIKNAHENSKNGGKVNGLIRMNHAGIRIPSTYIVGVDGYKDYILHGGTGELNILEEIAKNVKSAMGKLGGRRVILRSSAENEDGMNYSFSGMYCSVLLYGEMDNIIDAVEKMLKAPLQEWYIEYCKKINCTIENDYFTIIIQEYIEADVGGVMFTRNPVKQNREIVIELTNGGNEEVTGGNNYPSLVSVDNGEIKGWNGKIENGEGDLKFGTDELLYLAKVGRKIEMLNGCAQDIEWVIKDGKFYFLQSRNITT